MPQISSTITRQQSDEKAIPKLPKPIEEMTSQELFNFFATHRVDRVQASEKRKSVREQNKKDKANGVVKEKKTKAKKLSFEEMMAAELANAKVEALNEGASPTDDDGDDETTLINEPDSESDSENEND